MLRVHAGQSVHCTVTLLVNSSYGNRIIGPVQQCCTVTVNTPTCNIEVTLAVAPLELASLSTRLLVYMTWNI